ncbi:MAG: hypothetical protein KC492_29340 [Myxococcales bacterium]|nr:hypothetical protein [Myxococcales bacterium]
MATLVASAETSLSPLVADFGRVGAARLGMSQAEAATALSFELTTGYEIPEDEKSCYVVYRKGDSRPKLLLMMSNDELVRYDVYEATIRTTAGIGVGSSESDVKAAYGENVQVKPHFYTDGHYLVASGPDGVKLLFETDGSKVTAFRSGREPHVNYVEGCS